MILNFTDYLMPLCKKIITNKDKIKFTIMAYRYVEYLKEGLFCGISGNSTIKEHYIMEKSGEKLQIDEGKLLKLYNGPIKIKKSKFNDVTELACKYVPQEYQWFYSTLIAEEEDTTNSNYKDLTSDFED